MDAATFKTAFVFGGKPQTLLVGWAAVEVQIQGPGRLWGPAGPCPELATRAAGRGESKFSGFWESPSVLSDWETADPQT